MWANKKPLILGSVAFLGSLVVLGLAVVRMVDLRQVLNLPQAASTTVTCTVQPVTLSADKKTATIKVWGTDNTVDGRAVRIWLEKSDGTTLSPLPTAAPVPQGGVHRVVLEDGASRYHYFLGSCQVFSDVVSGKCPQTNPLTVTVSGLTNGNYTVHCDTSNLKPTDTSRCTGNPFCPCSGWKVCSSSDSQNFTIGGNAPPPPPANTATITGLSNISNVQVTIDGGSPTTANPYTFSNLSAGIHRVIATIPPGYTVKSTMCPKGMNCHTQACIDKVAPCPVMDAVYPGNNRSVSLKAGQNYEIYWHFTKTGTGATHLVCVNNSCVQRDGEDKNGVGCSAAAAQCVIDHEMR